MPTMLALAAKEAHLPGLDLSHVESIFTGSAPSTDALFDRMAQVFPNARVMNGYGTTETGPLAFGAHPGGNPPQTLARLPSRRSNGTRRWRDRERRRAVASQPPAHDRLPQPARDHGEAGDDGWYNTGDVMRRDADGFFFFVGRADDMFVCGGENIYPGEVEKLLERHPAVAQSAVVPVADEIKGEMPFAFVVRVPGAHLERGRRDQGFALANAPAYQHPRFVAFVDAAAAGRNQQGRPPGADRERRGAIPSLTSAHPTISDSHASPSHTRSRRNRQHHLRAGLARPGGRPGRGPAQGAGLAR